VFSKVFHKVTKTWHQYPEFGPKPGEIKEKLPKNGQSEPTHMSASVGSSVHRMMGWMIHLFFIHLFTLLMLTNILSQSIFFGC